MVFTAVIPFALFHILFYLFPRAGHIIIFYSPSTDKIKLHILFYIIMSHTRARGLSNQRAFRRVFRHPKHARKRKIRQLPNCEPPHRCGGSFDRRELRANTVSFSIFLAVRGLLSGCLSGADFVTGRILVLYSN